MMSEHSELVKLLKIQSVSASCKFPKSNKNSHLGITQIQTFKVNRILILHNAFEGNHSVFVSKW